MPRLGRRSAGERVARRAASLSDSLLDVEEAAFAEILGVLERRAPRARRALNASWSRARGSADRVRADARLIRELRAEHEAALGATTRLVRALGERSRRLSLDSIRDELGWCEDTLARRHEGAAERAVGFAEQGAQKVVDALVRGYEDTLPGVASAFVKNSKRQVILSARAGEPAEAMADRLLSPEPLSLPGNTGRGTWHRSGPWLTAQARAVSIGVMNGVRASAIDGFNAAWRDGFRD